jgi:hypothetical protein
MDNLLSSLRSCHGCGYDLIIIDCNAQSNVTVGVLNFAYVMTHDRDRESRGSTLNGAIAWSHGFDSGKRSNAVFSNTFL